MTAANRPTDPSQPLTVAIIAYPGCLASSIGLPAELLNAASDYRHAHASQSPRCQIVMLAEQASVECSGGIQLQGLQPLDQADRAEIILLPALWRNPLHLLRKQPALCQRLQQWAAEGRTIAAVGSASYLLAEAGLLVHRAATTHWSRAEHFQRRYPEVNFQANFLITQSDRLYCVASVNALADLTIHFIERLFGRRTAEHVSKHFSPEARVPYATSVYEESQRDQHEQLSFSQRKKPLQPSQRQHRVKPDYQMDVNRLIDWIKAHMNDELSNAELASLLAISERELHRRLQVTTQLSPQQLVERLRMEQAKNLLKNTRLSNASVADEIGFSSQSYFGKRFKNHTGQSPAAYRKLVQRQLRHKISSAKP